jgi:hypothetical protein
MMWILHLWWWRNNIHRHMSEPESGGQVLGMGLGVGKFFLYYIPLVTVIYIFTSMLQIRLFLKFLPNRHSFDTQPTPCGSYVNCFRSSSLKLTFNIHLMCEMSEIQSRNHCSTGPLFLVMVLSYWPTLNLKSTFIHLIGYMSSFSLFIYLFIYLFRDDHYFVCLRHCLALKAFVWNCLVTMAKIIKTSRP